MIVKFDSDNHRTIYKCKVCGHTYVEYYDYKKTSQDNGEPFIKMEEPLLRTVSIDWGPNRIERVTQYACPKCGVLQIDTGSI